MSRTREIAIEFWGEQEGKTMTAAEVYQGLARYVVVASTKLIPLTDRRVRDLQITEWDHFYLTTMTSRTGEHSHEALAATAYAFGYEAQMADAKATDPSSRYEMLDKLASIWRIMTSEQDV